MMIVSAVDAKVSLRLIMLVFALCCPTALASACARQPQPVPEVAPTREATPASIASPSPTQSVEAPETATTEATPTLVATPSVAERFTPVSWFHYGIGGLKGLEADTFARPTGLAVAPDGTLFVATAAHSHIFHIDPYGKVLASWGDFAQAGADGKAPPGTFNEPWGMAITPDGFLYIADTWHHRMQKFSLDGQFAGEWGEGGQGNDPYKLFGPRGVAVDSRSRVLVTDTGNKRVVVYDADGRFISQLGQAGAGPGEFDEPVGIAVDAQDNVYVADAWNRRVQVLHIDAAGSLSPRASWPVEGWGSQSVDHKPFLCLANGHVFATDPEHDRVLEYTPQGELLKVYDINSTGAFGNGTPTGIASDPAGGLWVSDLTLHMWLHILPQQ